MSVREASSDAVRARSWSMIGSPESSRSMSSSISKHLTRRGQNDSSGYSQLRLQDMEQKFEKVCYFQLSDDMRASIRLRDRFVGLKRVERCVTAQEVTAWLLRESNSQCVVKSKGEALFLGSLLIEYGHLYAVADEDEDGFGYAFRDDNELLQFSCDARNIAERRRKRSSRRLALRFREHFQFTRSETARGWRG